MFVDARLLATTTRQGGRLDCEKNISLFRSLEDVGEVAYEPSTPRPLFGQFDDIVKPEHGDHLTRRSERGPEKRR